MKMGRTFSQAAIYLPLEDERMKGLLPEKIQKPSSFYHWELHETKVPEKLKGYRPLWITDYFLKDAVIKNDLDV